VLTDEEFRVTYFNPAAERIFGFGRDEMQGRTLEATIVAPAGRAVHTMLCARLRRGETVAETSANVDKQGRAVQLEWRHLPLKRPDGVFVGAMSMAVDVTERERAERELERLNRELEQRVQERTGELEAANHELEAFSYSVSHDLRAPVRHIGAYLHLLAAELGEGISAPAREYLADAAAADRRMARIIDDLLAFSRSARAPLVAQPVALEPLVQEAIAELAPEAAGRRIDWRVATLATVEADPALLGIALKNLLGNAVKYTRPRATAHIAIAAAAGATGEVVISVQDDGVGFDMRHAGKLFNAFQRLHDAQEFEGTGIGLATVQRIVQRHGGRIWAEAEPGRGATCRFTLPAAS
jgi:PAS domain S-box-containing protein